MLAHCLHLMEETSEMQLTHQCVQPWLRATVSYRCDLVQQSRAGASEAPVRISPFTFVLLTDMNKNTRQKQARQSHGSGPVRASSENQLTVWNFNTERHPVLLPKLRSASLTSMRFAANLRVHRHAFLLREPVVTT